MSDLFTRDEARELLDLVHTAAASSEASAPAPVLERGLTKAERLKRLRVFAERVAAARIVQSACEEAMAYLRFLPEVLCKWETREEDVQGDT
jgi:hypothetical protein